jgi:hypothetical protein
MTVTQSTALRTALCNAYLTAFDSGSTCTIEVRSGTRPAGPGTTATGTLLATIALGDPSFTESGGVLTIVNPAPVTAVATGTATWGRLLNNTTAVMDLRVTATGGGGDLTLATTSITSGLSVDVTGGTLTVPAGTAD